MTSQKPITTGYRGRVRSGCLTCRSRKVKCDEVRPVCHNCARLKRTCTYKPRKAIHGVFGDSNVVDSTPTLGLPSQENEGEGTPELWSNLSPPGSEAQIDETNRDNCIVERSAAAYTIERDPFKGPENYPGDVTIRLEKALKGPREAPLTPEERQGDVESPSTLISRDIELTTTMDLLVARGLRLQLSSSFFIEAVECPGITPYDSTNWELWKHHAVELGGSCPAIALAVSAIAALHKAQMYRVSLSRALSLYESTKSVIYDHLEKRSHDFSTELIAVFLLCVFDFIYSGETTPMLREPRQIFTTSLEAWSQQPSTHSALSMRLVAWFRILYVTTIRGGGMGLISEETYDLFPNYDCALPIIKAPATYQSDVSTHLYQVLGAPLFDFYFRLQMLSGEIARLTHYHRSRTTGVDQEEVVAHITKIKERLRGLWESRCATQCQTPNDLRSQLAPKIANHVISLIGICSAAYHAEIVEIDRVLGDPVSKWTDSRPSIRSIRDIVDGDWCPYLQGDTKKINPGYMRPLFLYAIECMNQEHNQWAVDRIAQIHNPIYRSSFFSAFGKALSDAQTAKERRVTSKYFCISFFGVAPPYM